MVRRGDGWGRGCLGVGNVYLANGGAVQDPQVSKVTRQQLIGSLNNIFWVI